MQVRFEFEQQAEARRRARWGHSSHHTRFQQGDQNVFSGEATAQSLFNFINRPKILLQVRKDQVQASVCCVPMACHCSQGHFLCPGPS